MSVLINPLASPTELQTRLFSSLPLDLQDLLFYATASLTLTAGLLLELPLSVTAQACVLVARYHLSQAQFHEFLSDEPANISAAILYSVAKTSSHPISIESVTSIYRYLVWYEGSPFLRKKERKENKSENGPEATEGKHSEIATSSMSSHETPQFNVGVARKCYLAPTEQLAFDNTIFALESKILMALGFDTHVALPHPLAITYLKTLDFLGLPMVNEKGSSGMEKPATKTGKDLAKRTTQYLNTALISPQLLYLTHSPPALAVAAIYAAAKDLEAKMPDCSWWEVFDVEREELGFLVVGMRSLDGWIRKAEKDGEGDGIDGGLPGYGRKGMPQIKDFEDILNKRGIVSGRAGEESKGSTS